MEITKCTCIVCCLMKLFTFGFHAQTNGAMDSFYVVLPLFEKLSNALVHLHHIITLRLKEYWILFLLVLSSSV